MEQEEWVFVPLAEGEAEARAERGCRVLTDYEIEVMSQALGPPRVTVRQGKPQPPEEE